jgi:hypothetical protein
MPVVEHSKVLLLEPLYGLARFVGDDNIQHKLIRRIGRWFGPDLQLRLPRRGAGL